jgi:CheY-like chemotaxis protein
MRKRKIIIVEDEPNYRAGLSEFLSRDAEIIAFADPDECAQAITDQADLYGVSHIILDYRFDHYNMHQKDLVTYFRDDLKFRGKIVLWSLEDRFPDGFIEKLDAVLPKKLLSLPEIEQCIERY